MQHTHIRRTLVMGLVILAGIAVATHAWAGVPVTGRTGLFGVMAGQSIGISIVNAGARGGIQPCVGIFDIRGNLLAEIAAPAPLRPGEGTFVTFDAAALGVRRGQRMQVRAEVELEFSSPPDDNQPPDPTFPPVPVRTRRGDVIATLEVFDPATGRTAFTMPWVLVGFNPQPEPPAR
jgi:hypothetical protein